jgi:deoxyadenosine/deoxycytidine kinase
MFKERLTSNHDSTSSECRNILEIRYYGNKINNIFIYYRRIIFEGKEISDQIEEISFEKILNEPKHIMKKYKVQLNLEKEENLLYRFVIWEYFNTFKEILNDIKEEEYNKLIFERKLNSVRKIEEWILKKCQKRRQVIILEGSIGVGKTCITEKLKEVFLKKRKTVKVLHETVEEWRDTLDKFYKEPLKYRYQLEMEIIKSRNKQLRNCNRITEIIIMDRTSLSSYFFMSLTKEPVTLKDLIEYKNEINEMEKERDLLRLEKAKIIRIEMTAEECLKRIKLRGRNEEKNISLEYLEKLNEKYEHDLIQVYKVNTNQIFVTENERGKLDNTVWKIMEFIQPDLDTSNSI